MTEGPPPAGDKDLGLLLHRATRLGDRVARKQGPGITGQRLHRDLDQLLAEARNQVRAGG